MRGRWEVGRAGGGGRADPAVLVHKDGTVLAFVGAPPALPRLNAHRAALRVENQRPEQYLSPRSAHVMPFDAQAGVYAGLARCCYGTVT